MILRVYRNIGEKNGKGCCLTSELCGEVVYPMQDSAGKGSCGPTAEGCQHVHQIWRTKHVGEFCFDRVS